MGILNRFLPTRWWLDAKESSNFNKRNDEFGELEGQPERKIARNRIERQHFYSMNPQSICLANEWRLIGGGGWRKRKYTPHLSKFMCKQLACFISAWLFFSELHSTRRAIFLLTLLAWRRNKSTVARRCTVTFWSNFRSHRFVTWDWIECQSFVFSFWQRSIKSTLILSLILYAFATFHSYFTISTPFSH